MKFVLFYHSFTSCWNHGNAHFLRGISRELLRRGHAVVVYEPIDGWSLTNALAEAPGSAALPVAEILVPGIILRRYRGSELDFDEALAGADVVVAHEWTSPEIISNLGRRRRAGGQFRLLFHDTHHRAVTSADDLARLDIEAFDAVLAFGEVLREVYVRRGWGHQAFTWHEAADLALFRPMSGTREDDLIWIGNWGDGERSKEIQEYLLDPVAKCSLKARIFGVRYPQDVRDLLNQCEIAYGGWLPNHLAPATYGRARLTVHIPRRPYVEALPGIPTIRVFEALACGIPLVCAPWRDVEKLFPAGSYLSVANGSEMSSALRLLLHEPAAAAELSERGLAAIHARHSCAHRADELLAILQRLDTRRGDTSSVSRQALAS